MTVRSLSRRRALQLGGLGAAGIVVGGTGLAFAGITRYGAAEGETLTAPTILTSAAGALNLTLEAAVGRGPEAGREATTLRYNGGLPGPTLHLRAGDHLGVDLVNHLDQPTNLHTHGLRVSPQGNSDNPFVMVNPGETFHYDYQLPETHPAGTFWYHPHHHGLAADQVFGGLYGAIVIDEPDPPQVSADRVLVISDITLDSSGAVQPATGMQRMTGREGDLIMVNGQANPHLTAHPGTRERWRIVNACVARYLRLRLDGQDLHLLGIDLPLGDQPPQVDEVPLAPGNRADLLVTTRTGTSTLRTLPYNRGTPMGVGDGMGMGGGMSSQGADSGRPVIELATLTVTGTAAPALAALSTRPTLPDLRGTIVTTRRTLTLAMGMGMGMGMDSGGRAFTIDGRRFDSNRVDQTVAAGAVEEWTITNTSPMDHPFHLHVWPMQVLTVAGRATDAPTWQNVVNVPARSSTVVRIAFDTHTGRTVYHCHILDHEDNGMPGVIEVG
ncbi:MAG TPA: multicopper oxidase family protein [Nakamurella sp.]